MVEMVVVGWSCRVCMREWWKEEVGRLGDLGLMLLKCLSKCPKHEADSLRGNAPYTGLNPWVKRVRVLETPFRSCG